MSTRAVLIAPPVYRDRRVPYFRPLEEAGLQLRFNDFGRRFAKDELIARLDGVVATVAASEPYSARVFTAAASLRCVARFGVGFDVVDVAAASRHGVAVAMAFGANHEAVATTPSRTCSRRRPACCRTTRPCSRVAGAAGCIRASGGGRSGSWASAGSAGRWPAA